MVDSSLVSNQALSSSALGSAVSLEATGGAMSSNGAGTIRIERSVIRNNRIDAQSSTSGTVAAFGGGLRIASTQGGTTSMTIIESDISDNVATAPQRIVLSGGLEIRGANSDLLSVRVDKSTLANNTAEGQTAEGGGIRMRSSSPAQLTIINSTLSGNRAKSTQDLAAGAGLNISGVNANPLRVDVISTTIAFNVSEGPGATGGDLVLLAPSATTELQLGNSVIGLNEAPASPDCATPQTGGESNGFNFIGDLAGCVIDGDVQSGFSPMLDPLADNGGPTLTHGLQAESMLIEASDPTGCKDELGRLLADDQRKMPRPAGACDLGAFERQ